MIQKYSESTSRLTAYEAEAAPFPSAYFTKSEENVNPVPSWTEVGNLLEPEGYSKDNSFQFYYHIPQARHL